MEQFDAAPSVFVRRALHTSIGAGSAIKWSSEIVYRHFGQGKAAAKALVDEDRDRLADAIAEDHRCDDVISLLASVARERGRLLGGRSEREFQWSGSWRQDPMMQNAGAPLSLKG
jgi:hypothetical protein